jgi:hypothetical protein
MSDEDIASIVVISALSSSPEPIANDQDAVPLKYTDE